MTAPLLADARTAGRVATCWIDDDQVRMTFVTGDGDEVPVAVSIVDWTILASRLNGLIAAHEPGKRLRLIDTDGS